MPAQSPSPQWQPIERVGLIASHVDGMLEAAEEQYESLQLARPKPHILDEYTVGRVIEVFTVQRDDLWLFDEQLRRWKAGRLTTSFLRFFRCKAALEVRGHFFRNST